eukprot:403360734
MSQPRKNINLHINGTEGLSRKLASTTNQQELYSCGQCLANSFDYCQPKSKGIFFYDTKGVCEDSAVIKALYPSTPYYYSDQFYSQSKLEFFSYFPCPFFTQKCGASSSQLYMSEDEKSFETSLLEVGDICVFEINYGSADSNLKLWLTKLSNVEVTIADGFQKHPYETTGSLTFVSKLLSEGDEFEVGDYWYNITQGGKAYLFIKSKSTYGYAHFSYGQKNLLPKWALILIIVGSVVVGLACLFICCCYVRRLYIRRKQNQSKVQKFNRVETVEERIGKYKYKSGALSQKQSLATKQNNGPNVGPYYQYLDQPNAPYPGMMIDPDLTNKQMHDFDDLSKMKADMNNNNNIYGQDNFYPNDPNAFMVPGQNQAPNFVFDNMQDSTQSHLSAPGQQNLQQMVDPGFPDTQNQYIPDMQQQQQQQQYPQLPGQL